MDGFLHMSSIQKYRHKVHDLVENPKMSVSIHNDGANLRRQKAILLIGHAEVSTDDAPMRKIHWAIIDKYWSEVKDPEQREAAFAAVHTPLRVIIKVIPEKTIPGTSARWSRPTTRACGSTRRYQMVEEPLTIRDPRPAWGGRCRTVHVEFSGG